MSEFIKFLIKLFEIKFLAGIENFGSKVLFSSQKVIFYSMLGTFCAKILCLKFSFFHNLPRL